MIYELELTKLDGQRVYLVSSVLGELRGYLTSYLDSFSSGTLFGDGKKQWAFSRVSGAVHWSRLS